MVGRTRKRIRGVHDPDRRVTLVRMNSPLVIALLLAGLAPRPQEGTSPYSCGPFLLRPGERTMTIVVDHKSDVPAVLTWCAVGSDTSQIEHSEPKRHHIFTLEELEPGQDYAYEVHTGDSLSSGARRFRTLPHAPPSYRLIAVGDVRSQPMQWERVATRIFEHEDDALFVIGTGDYPSDGRQYPLWIAQFFKPARDLLARKPLWPAIGNHEATRPHGTVKPELSKYFSLFELPGNEHWYRVDYHLVTLLVLDSNSRMGTGLGAIPLALEAAAFQAQSLHPGRIPPCAIHFRPTRQVAP